MSSYNILNTQCFGEDNWCLSFQPLYNSALLTSLSNGEVQYLDWVTGKPKQSVQAAESSINKLKVINSDYHASSAFAVATIDSVKIFDVRSNNNIAILKSDKNAPFLSLDSRHGLLACGTELSGVDAELYVYDIRRWNLPVKSFVDSHHDDITDLKFHPSDPNVLLSGSTDGYTNIYDLTQDEEEDALHQVISYASIHSCGWLSPKRIYTLSHMETFAIHELNDKTDELREPRPLDYGDVRKLWDCDYVIDVYPGFLATGSSKEGSTYLKLLPLVEESVDIENALSIPSAHDNEVIRDVLVPSQNSDLLYSCGEDGCVKIWQNSNGPLKVPSQFWDYSKTVSVLDDTSIEAEVATVDKTVNVSDITEGVKNGDIGAQLPEEHKKKKSQTKKHSKTHRYKPY